VVFGQSRDKIRFQNDLGFVLSQGLTPFTCYAFYRAAMNRVIALACAEHSGHYSLEIPNALSVDDQVNKLKQIEKLQQEKSELAGKLKKEKNLGTQVQLNTQIKQITDRIKAVKAEL